MADASKQLLYGTLDTLILKTLEDGPRHGYGIARWLETATDERIRIDESSLYPALYRLHEKGLLEAEWGRSELDRRAKFYRLTPSGRRRLESATAEWQEFSDAVSGVLGQGEG
ncbi:MAG TPA: PadR family transcriptional regulator [Longimicrobiales bacterium]|nr:PadR family transcriptional regulator [Longimicrobiales bacterium]